MTDSYKVFPIDNVQTKEWYFKKHYAKRYPMVVFSFGLFDNDNILQGVLSYGMPPSPSINDGKSILKTIRVKTLELNRVCINDGLPKNICSFFISKSFEFLQKPLLIISFADPFYNHNGYIYQATNFYYTGKSEVSSTKNIHVLWKGKILSSRWLNKNFFTDKKLPFDDDKTVKENLIINGGDFINFGTKHRYIYILANKTFKKKILKDFKLEILPYPKGDNLKYDSSFNPNVNYKLDL